MTCELNDRSSNSSGAALVSEAGSVFCDVSSWPDVSGVEFSSVLPVRVQLRRLESSVETVGEFISGSDIVQKVVA